MPVASRAPQELGILALISRGVRVLTATGDDLTDDSDPWRVMMRSYEKARLVAKLKAARDRKRAGGKAGGRKRWADINPELVKAAQRLRSTSPRPDRSMREIAVNLQELGYVNERGRDVFAVVGCVNARGVTAASGRRAPPVQRLIAAG